MRSYVLREQKGADENVRGNETGRLALVEHGHQHVEHEDGHYDGEEAEYYESKSCKCASATHVNEKVRY